MLYRYTIAFMLVAAVAGACSGSQNEGVSPGTAASTTTDTAASTTIGGAVSTTVDAAVSTTTELVQPSTAAAIPATTIPVAATPPVAATVPEVEVPPSTALSVGTAPETSAPTETAVPSTTVPDAATVPVVTAVPEAEVPPSTASPARTAPETSEPAVSATTVPEVLLRNGVAMVGWDLTVETAEVVDAAVEACSEVFETSIMAGCTAAVWAACDSQQSSYAKMYRSAGVTNFEVPESDFEVPEWGLFINLSKILCFEAYAAEVVELAMVLAAKYGDRYYSEDVSLPFGDDPDYDLQDFENDYRWSGGYIVFAEGVKRDFIDFRMYIGRKEWDPRPALAHDSLVLISDEAHVRVDPLFGTLGELLSAFSASSSEPFEGFDAEKIIAFYAASDSDGRVIDLPVDPEEVKVFCDEAAFAARLRRPNWINGVNDCVMAVEDCVNKFVEVQHDICTNRLLYDARQELMWKDLPVICAAAEDVDEESYNDSCRQSVLDLHMLRMGPLIDADALVNQHDDRLQYFWLRTAFFGRVSRTTFFLAQPLIADLAIEYRTFYALIRIV